MTGYSIVFTTNPNYADPNTRSGINIGEGQTITGKVESCRFAEVTPKSFIHT